MNLMKIFAMIIIVTATQSMASITATVGGLDVKNQLIYVSGKGNLEINTQSGKVIMKTRNANLLISDELRINEVKKVYADKKLLLSLMKQSENESTKKARFKNIKINKNLEGDARDKKIADIKKAVKAKLTKMIKKT